MFDRINQFLDRYVLPWPVRFLTFRFVILVTIALLVPLIVYADETKLVLLINSYLNTMSVQSAPSCFCMPRSPKCGRSESQICRSSARKKTTLT
jgi:hypothetical protein